MKKFIVVALAALVAAVCMGVASVIYAGDEIEDYTGPFTIQVLYNMCSRSDRVSRDKAGVNR
jgi:hypothetical protein